MQTAGNFLNNLCLTELGSLPAFGDEYLSMAGLSETNQRKLIAVLNQGLKELTSRFCLVRKSVLVITLDHLTQYYLRPEYAQSSDSEVTHKYLYDVSDPFTGDFVKVISVFNEVGLEMPLNDVMHEASLFTPQFDVLQVPFPGADNAYEVIYQARHPEITNENLETQKLLVPPMLDSALTAFVAGKTFSNIGGEGPTVKGSEFMARYESLCGEVELKDLGNTSQTRTNTKSELRGWP